ncbi:MAG: hypothetical protein ACT4NY_28310 [Pseudonocardiales bacterium]
MTILSTEQQTMNFYLNVGPEYMEPIARQLYHEIAMVEEEHVTYYGSMLDPGETWWERWEIGIYFLCGMLAKIAESGPPPLGLHLVMGNDAPVKIKNMVEGLERGVLAPIELICSAR